MTQWKIFGGQAWAALKSSLKSLKEAVDGNTSAVSGLGMELAEMAETTAAALNGKQDKPVSYTHLTLPTIYSV